MSANHRSGEAAVDVTVGDMADVHPGGEPGAAADAPQVLSAEAQAFLRTAEARQEAAVDALEMVSAHYNRTLLRDALCLQYDGIYRDSLATDPAAQYLTLEGYRCRHPAAERQLLHMELAIHSARRTAPDAESLLSEADAFFRSAVFTSIPASP